MTWDNNIDVYKHSYEYDEVKVVTMLSKHCLDINVSVDWEDLMQVAHNIYTCYCAALTERKIHFFQEWMLPVGEEEGYIQKWLERTLPQWAVWYHADLTNEPTYYYTAVVTLKNDEHNFEEKMTIDFEGAYGTDGIKAVQNAYGDKQTQLDEQTWLEDDSNTGTTFALYIAVIHKVEISLN